MDFVFFPLTDEQKQFLSTYRPKDDMVTSYTEIKEVRKQLGIGTTLKQSDMQALRNSVVKFYSDKMEPIADSQSSDLRSEFWNFMQAMQSVTAVIDAVIYQQ